MASITGFGQSGPKKNFACNDLVALAESGFLYISGDPELPPCKPPETQAYYFATLFAAAGVLATLYQRERPGKVITSIRRCKRPSLPRSISSGFGRTKTRL
jgi:crotonobetainyl-CoA:carnitine CoA-transferase CaiB-like acyl-CoA transferase